MRLEKLNRMAVAVQTVLQPIVIIALIAATIAVVTATGMALAGELPWPRMVVGYGDTFHEIGMYVHACAEAVEGSVVRASSSAYPRQNSSVGMNPAARVMTTCGVPMAACTPHSTA